MKEANIALFKQFLTEHGANKLFCGLYKQYRFPENPQSVEVYLTQVDSNDAITSAFQFPDNITTFGPDYWLDLAVKWEERKKDATADGNIYGLHAADRMAKQAAKPLEMWDSRKFEKKRVRKPAAVPVTPRNGATEEQSVLSGFKFFDIKKASNRRLNDDQISLNIKSSYSITFNKTLSDEIRKSKLEYMQVGQKGSEQALFFVFSNDENGIAHRNNDSNVSVYSKELVCRIIEFFGLKDEYNVLHISKNMANSKDYITYKITK